MAERDTSAGEVTEYLLRTWPLLSTAVLYCAQAGIYAGRGQWAMCGAWIAYAVANLCFSMVK